MSNEDIYCFHCFNKLRRVIGGFGCPQCETRYILWGEELGLPDYVSGPQFCDIETHYCPVIVRGVASNTL